MNVQTKRPRDSRKAARGLTFSISGGGGTRTPKRFRAPHFECGALPVRTTPPVLHTSSRGARIRTGDLCVPNAALYQAEPRPVLHTADGVGFEPTRAYTHTISNRAP